MFLRMRRDLEPWSTYPLTRTVLPCIGTDGSKTSDGVGCAFVAGRDTRSFSLPASATVFSAELLVIDKALCFIEVGDEDLHLILTDCLSSLLALISFNPTDPLVHCTIF